MKLWLKHYEIPPPAQCCKMLNELRTNRFGPTFLIGLALLALLTGMRTPGAPFS
jgi:hypothetical protein